MNYELFSAFLVRLVSLTIVLACTNYIYLLTY